MKGLEERFWDKVEKSETCWNWLAKRDKNGYGRFSPNGSNSQMPAHRFSWSLHNGEIPDGLLVCHHCDNPSCVNPEHLFLGTPQDNMDDKVRKGRWRGNPDSINLKTHLESILALRSSGKDLRSIAKDFDCDRSAVKRLLEKNGVYAPLTTGPSRLVEPHLDSIITRRDAGETLSSIATSFGCDKGVIRRLLDKHGEYTPIKPGPRKPHNVRTAKVREREAEIKDLLAAKTPVSRMAKIFGVGRATMVRILKTLSVSSGSLHAA